MVGDTVPQETDSAVAGSDTESVPLATRWPRRRVQRVASRFVLGLGCLLTTLLLMILGACFINDRAIESSRGTAVAEVLETSWTRTVVRFNTDDGRVFIPPGGVLYPAGLREGMMVRVEFDKQNPDLVRVAGRDVSVALLPVFSAVAVVWAVVLPLYWVLRRAASAGR